jgi:histidinol-phosphate aminotransferase
MIRSNCAGFEPYVAGKPVETIKRELGLKKVVKLASNENPMGPSPKALAAVKKAMSDMYFYPDSNSWELKQALAKKFRLKPGNILLGCGSDEIIELIARLFFRVSDDIIASEHAFVRYQMAGKLMNCTVRTVPMKNYTHDLSAMAAAMTVRTKAIFICNPNNPTGTYNTKKELEAFLNTVEEKSVDGAPPLVIMDEAYYEYARGEKDYPETINYLSRYPNLVILRTFSKVYGLAGLRVGYGFASAEIVDYIDRIRPPFNVNLLAQRAAVASLEDKDQVKRSMAVIKEGKKYLYAELKKLGLPFVPTASNFILIDLSPALGSEVFKKMLRCGVIVRAMDEYSYPNHIRVTLGLPSENRLFISSLKKVLKK